MGPIIAMLIWAGHAHGGPATLGGFASLEACERARPMVEARFQPLSGLMQAVRTGCIVLPSS